MQRTVLLSIGVVVLSMLSGCTTVILGCDKLYIADLRTGETNSRNTCRGLLDFEEVVGVNETADCFHTLQVRPPRRDSAANTYVFRTWDYSGQVVSAKTLPAAERRERMAFSQNCKYAVVLSPPNECLLYDIQAAAQRRIELPYSLYGRGPVWVDSTRFIVLARMDDERAGLLSVDITNDKAELIMEHPSFAEVGDLFTSVSPDGHYLAFFKFNMVVVDLVERKVLSVSGDVFPMDGVLAWSPESDKLAYATGGKSFYSRIVSLPDGKEIGKIEESPIPYKFLDPDRLLCRSGNALRIENIRTGETESSIKLRSNSRGLIVIDNKTKVVYTDDPSAC